MSIRFRVTTLVTLILVFCLSAGALGQTVITYLGRGGNPEREMYSQVIASFMEENPDIIVDMDWVGGGADAIFERILVRMAAGIAPDVFWIHSYHTADMAEMNLLLALDELMVADTTFDHDDIFPAALGDFTYRGDTVALPRETSSVVLFYNEELFDQTGLQYPDESWDWEHTVASARKMTQSDGDTVRYGMVAPTGGGFDMAVVWQNEGRTLTEDRTKATFSSPAVVEAYQWIADLMHVHEVAPKPGQPGGGDNEFRAGNLGMFYNIRGRASSIGTETRWDVAPLPVGKTRATRIASSGHAIYKDTAKSEAAWRFLSYLTSPAAQEVFSAGGLSIPALRSVALSEAFIDPTKPPASDHVFLGSLLYARSEPVTRSYFDVVRLKNNALTAIWSGNVPAQQVLMDLDRQVDALLSE